MTTQNQLLNLDDETLLKRTESLVRSERETTTTILHHFREVERRKLYATLGYSSLFAYCLNHLGYSESGAQRRIASMRLLRDLPEIEDALRKGRLSLSVAAQAHSFFKQEADLNQPLLREQRLEIVRSLEEKSSREAERELIRRSSSPVPLVRDRIRPLHENISELKVHVSDETLEELERVRGLLAHSHPNLSWSELIALLAKMAIRKLDPANEPARARKARNRAPDSLPTSEVKRRIPGALRRAVFRRDGGQCTFTDPKTGRKCGSRYGLEIDHIQPYAMNGETRFENLRLLCRNHHRRRTIEVFGLARFERHHRSSARELRPKPEPQAPGAPERKESAG